MSFMKQSSPAFMASLSMFVTCTVDAPLVFDREQLDTRQAYDTRHGLFRAPVNGTYMFTATIAAQPNQGFHVKLVRNSLSDEIGYLFSDNGHSGWNERSTTIVVKLAAGDDVWLACTMPSNITGGNSGMEHDYHSHFSGFFIDAF
ncbi:hypothetical protein DPMN_044284 [Dreissena polymorpha]|uniref:C1q domain-containing protein n=1 Tax=Dreissena polymorpha TaxID=45954 RepID=A0A9D4D4B8_DREPO|nr:hypothetical protein DPMN_044284 [Dreissena polymorpha]